MKWKMACTNVWFGFVEKALQEQYRSANKHYPSSLSFTTVVAAELEAELERVRVVQLEEEQQSYLWKAIVLSLSQKRDESISQFSPLSYGDESH